MIESKFKAGDRPDEVNHPAHYTHGKYECVDVIEDWKLPWHLGNALKYICRADHKGDPIEDIKKAIWYLQRYAELKGGSNV